MKADTIVWWSAGAASTVAAMLTLRETPDARLIYTDPGAEHPDNVRFRNDVENWLGVKIEVMRSDVYKDVWDVWDRTNWLVGPAGARCTVEMKKKLRQQLERDSDVGVQVFGYTVEERRRVERFKTANPDVNLSVPLIDHGLTKADCLGLLENAGIELPAMYRLGYSNANCIGCPHGGAKYWSMIKRDFPDVFDRMAAQERRLNVALVKVRGERVFLDELDTARDDLPDTPMVECSLLCAAVESES